MQVIFLSFSVIGVIFFRNITERERKPLYFAPPNILQYFSMGYKDFLANILWLRLLQDADFCSFEKGIPVYRGDKKHCELGWSYRMVDTISELAPRFRTPYLFSPIILSVFTGDIKGAERILLKGLKYFPQDWRINLYATYIYLLDIKEPAKAAYYAFQSAENGGPHWLYSLAAKQYGEAEQLLLGETILKNLLKRELTDKQRTYAERHLREMREKYIEKTVPITK